MGLSSRSGRARTSARSPEAHAICDRCGRRWNRSDLSFQWDYRGNELQDIRLLVCRPCKDVPQNQLRPVLIPPDPLPIKDPRIENFAADEGPAPTPQTVRQILGI